MPVGYLLTQGLGSYGGSAGGCVPPTAPTLAVADAGDGTGGTATISGGDAGSTHAVYYVRTSQTLPTAPTWTSGGSRSGNGTVSLSLATGYYWFYVLATNADGTAVSNIVLLAFTSSEANLEASIRDYLGSQPDVTAIVGQRIFRVFVPQSARGSQADVGKLPRIVFQRITGGRTHFINKGDGQPMCSVQFSCQSTNYGEAKSIADAVRNCLDAFSGTMGGVVVRAAISDNETDLYESPDDAQDQGVHQTILDYRFSYVETAPSL